MLELFKPDMNVVFHIFRRYSPNHFFEAKGTALTIDILDDTSELYVSHNFVCEPMVVYEGFPDYEVYFI